MTWVLTSFGVLAASAIVTLALALARAPRLALGTAMLGVFVAALLSIIAAGSVLSGSLPIESQSVSWPLPLGTAHLALDGLSAWFLLTIGILAASVAVYSPAYMESPIGRAPAAAFGVLLCALMASLILVVCAADAVLFLVGWEAMMLVAFFFVAFHHDRPEVRRGAWMYLIANHIGTALFVLPLFAILTGSAGSTEFAAFWHAAGLFNRSMLIVLFALGLLGFGTKAGLMPMHIWLPAAHPVAPTPVSALLSGVLVKMGIYGLLRLLTWLPPLPTICGLLLLVVAVVSGVMGVLYALAQHDLKRLLAYHTVENIGIIALGISIGMLGQTAGNPALAALGYTGALLHVTNHALFKGLLFLSAGAVLHGTGTADIERLGGLAKQTPVNAFMFLVGAVAICGFPPLNGFVSEWVIYGSLFGGVFRGVGASGAAPALGLVSLALMGGLALACFAKVFGVVFLGQPRDVLVRAHPTPVRMKIAMGGLALICILIGVLPGQWLPLIRRPTSELVCLLPPADVEPAIRSVLAPAAKLSILVAVFVLVVIGLAVIRRRVLAWATMRDRTASAVVATWGCAYVQPTVRMQYTASSFAASLIVSFRALLWPHRELVSPAGPFPVASHLESHAPDIAEHDLFEPLFRGVTRLFAMVRTVSLSGESGIELSVTTESGHRGPLRTMLGGLVSALRRGGIQIRLAFIVVTLVMLLLIEAITSPTEVNNSTLHNSIDTAPKEVQP